MDVPRAFLVAQPCIERVPIRDVSLCLIETWVVLIAVCMALLSFSGFAKQKTLRSGPEAGFFVLEKVTIGVIRLFLNGFPACGS